MKRSIEALLEEKNPVLIEPDTSIADTARLLSEANEGAAIIVDQTRAVGILTLADIVSRVVAGDLDADKTTAGEVMTHNPVVIRSSCSVGNALFLMHEYSVHYIPVVDQDNCAIGVVRAADALASDLSEYAHDAEMLDHIAEII